MNKVKNILASFKLWDDALGRFPIFISMVAAICLIISLEIADIIEDQQIIKLIIVMVPMALAVLNLRIFKNALKIKDRIFFTYVLLIVIVTALFFIALPEDIKSDRNQYLGYVFGSLILALSFGVFLAFFPRKVDNREVIRFGTTLLFLWLDAFLSSLLLCLAMSLAILGIDELFNFNLGRHHAYEYLFVWGIGMFLTFRFLTHFPRHPYDGATTAYKTTGSFVVNYILIPSILIYGLILFVYGLKLMFIDHTFVSWLSVLLSIYFSVGVMTFALNMDNENQNGIAKFYDKYWLKLSLPILLLYIYDCYKTYTIEGVFETNYIVFGLCVLSVASMVYFIGYKEKDLRVLPAMIIGLAMFAILSGPLNIWNSSLSNQKTRLVEALVDNESIVGGSFTSPLGTIPYEVNLRKTIDYLRNKNELSFLKEYDDNGVLPKDINLISFFNKEEASGTSREKTFYENQNLPSISFKGEGYIIPSLNQIGGAKQDYSIDLRYDINELFLYQAGQILSTFPLSLDEYDKTNHTFNFENETINLTLYVQSISASINGQIDFIEGLGVIYLKQPTTAD